VTESNHGVLRGGKRREELFVRRGGGKQRRKRLQFRGVDERLFEGPGEQRHDGCEQLA